MAAVRRWYQYLVCFISLEAVTWAIIFLLRDLLTASQETPAESLAFQIAVIVVGFPLFLFHWLWAQRLAAAESEERSSAIRRLYLYGTLTAFLIPFLNDGYHLFATPLRAALGDSGARFGSELSVAEEVLRNLVAMGVFTLFGGYHYRVLTLDNISSPETELVAALRRLFIFAFSAVGLTLTLLGAIHVLRWLMYQVGGSGAELGSPELSLADEIARLIVGVPLWLFFWSWTQRRLGRGDPGEGESTLRKVYLYGVVFVSVFAVVSNGTIILAGLFRRLLSLPSEGDLRGPLPVMIGMLVPWVYHTLVLRQDEARAGEAPRQAVVRRVYHYLVAGVGLAAFLIGVSGNISVLLSLLEGDSFGDSQKEAVAWFSAALLAGLPVWLLPWRRAQLAAVAAGPEGAEERRSLVRKIYLYFFIFVATMVVLGGVIFIVFQLLYRLLGNTDELVLSYPLAFVLIAVGVWLYHGSALRGDGRLAQGEQRERLAALRVAVVDDGEGEFGRELLAELRRALPGLTLSPVALTPSAAEAMEAPASEENTLLLREAEVIVGPWSMMMPGAASPELAQAIIESPARKLLVPAWQEGWEWAGVNRWSRRERVEQTVSALRQIVEGEEVRLERGMGVGMIVLLLVGAFLLLSLLAVIFSAIASAF